MRALLSTSAAAVILAASPVAAQRGLLLSDSVLSRLAQESSGESAKRQLEAITRYHRMRGSAGFHAAAEHVATQARAYGLTDARIERFPADGRIFYGTQRSRPPWDAEFAELWELRAEGSGWSPAVRLASWESMPVSLAQDSESASVRAELVDIGNGTSESDYAGKDVKGRIVLAGAQPGAVAALAVARHGAAGIVSYAQNQRSAWWGDDDNLVRWGHLDTFAAAKTFAFMISLRQARAFRDRLGRGETVMLSATVKAGQHAGAYEIVTATIPGADARLRDDEIALSCHLDHQRPGANDNASGCSAILEVARVLATSIANGALARPARTIRFVWPPEIEGTTTLLAARPELARRIRAVIHMDMVGGGPVTKAIFEVHRGPGSLPSFVNDVAESFAELVNRQTAAFAATGVSAFPLVAPEGGKEPLRAELADFSLGSDHQVYTDASHGIPAIYFGEWPDRYIHTNFDSPANIDPTKLKRAAFLGAAIAYALADLRPDQAATVWSAIAPGSVRRSAAMLQRRAQLPPDEAAILTRFHWRYERALPVSMARFFPIPAPVAGEAASFYDRLEQTLGGAGPAKSRGTGDGALVFRRKATLKGPMSVFGYDYFTDHYGPDADRAVRLLSFEGGRGGGGDYAYEALNFADGTRTAQEIRDAVSAEYGPIPLELVVEFLRALEKAGVVER